MTAMDLNLNALPDEFEEPYEYNAPSDRIESAIDIAKRERDERRKRLRKDRGDDRSYNISQQSDQFYPSKHAKNYEKSRLPSGWLDCPPAGQEIRGLVPSKVPLGEAFNDCIPPGKRYSFKQVIHQQRVLQRKFKLVVLPCRNCYIFMKRDCYPSERDELGLVIDLTNTSRYYTTADLKKEGIKHVKIACVGRDAVPSNVQVNEFVNEVTQFFIRQKPPTKKYILVHCTHGHNRTGYMIVHFLMRCCQPMHVSQAIQLFADARPPGIYKPDYIEALYTFYHEKKPEEPICPATPEWKRSSELDLNGEAMPDEDDDGNLVAPVVNNNHEPEARMTNDDVLGDDIPRDQVESFRHFCYQSLKLPQNRGSSQFPGSHPVSLNRDNLQLLRQKYYYATWKADGTRYMMLITVDGCYLIDRSFNFRRVQMRFPCRNDDMKSAIQEMKLAFHHFTLLDGEMIIDTVPDSQKQERRYLIYDLMALNGTSVVERPFNERWKLIEKEVVEPRNYERQPQFQSTSPYRYELEPFRVRRKDFWNLSIVPKVLKEFIPKLSHDADGLIFQGWDDPYVPRTHEGLLKWKYPEMNSVDFLFEIDEDGQESLFLHDRGKKRMLDSNNRAAFTAGLDPSSYSGKIIECSFDNDEQVWVCMRTRVDKNTPNEYNTYRKVMRSIKDNITEEVLLGEIDDIIRLPMYADRIKYDIAHSNAARRR